ncbi:hypothetical protein [Anaeromicrobium sediminis]|uniref:CoA protein activase n=1 Tax=Anaeromicrobium sediminis TaxID=1478221 RepID=A0A267MB20_9FIRM|nr:hypothetical protein [Anaeromicrobium sediminis]PAB56647.1 hypothetical protein CCE28_20665 [Anaeromicrobium sediminis]
MKVTFPHMGNMYVPIKVLLETIGVDYVMPPFCNKKTVEYGVTHSPEFVCLPFKTMLGDFIHGIQNGADTILFCGGVGQCRLGYYGDLQSEILKSIGYKVEFISIDLTNMTVKEVMEKLKILTDGKSSSKVIKGIIYAVQTIFMVDKLYQLANYTRCREINKGYTDNVMKEFKNRVQNAKGYKGIKNEIILAKRMLKAIKIDRNSQPLKIAIVGEIYAATESYINLDIERKLGNMGVEVCNKLGVANWIMEHFIKNILPIKSKNMPHEAGKEFMRTDDIGGHGLETIGNAILSGKKEYDGVIHLYPFTCMPEIIAQSTFSEIQGKYNIPIITLILDEMTGEAGYVTRLEAFIDMLRMKRNFCKSSNQTETDAT